MDTIRGPGGKLRLNPESSEAKRRGAMLDAQDKQIAEEVYNQDRKIENETANAVDKDFRYIGAKGRVGKFHSFRGLSPNRHW